MVLFCFVSFCFASFYFLFCFCFFVGFVSCFLFCFVFCFVYWSCFSPATMWGIPLVSPQFKHIYVAPPIPTFTHLTDAVIHCNQPHNLGVSRAVLYVLSYFCVDFSYFIWLVAFFFRDGSWLLILECMNEGIWDSISGLKVKTVNLLSVSGLNLEATVPWHWHTENTGTYWITVYPK